ncbi:hypothetical protein D3C71_1375850 [compost metagenome]
MQHHVHAGGRTGGGDDAALVDVQRVLAHPHVGELAGEGVGESPVGGGAAAVEQAGPRQHEGTRTDRGDACAALVGAGERIQQWLRWALGRITPAGHHDGVGVVQRLQSVRQLHVGAAEHAQGSGFGGAHLGGVPSHVQLGADGREQADGAAELEQALAVAGRNGDGGRCVRGMSGEHRLMLAG